MKYRAAALCIALLFAARVEAQDLEEPRFSFSLTGGTIKPDTKNFATYYADDTPGEFGAKLGWKPMRVLELGGEASYFSARGVGDLPLNGSTGGNVLHEVAPMGIYAVIRGQTTFDQLVIPYVGAGVSRVYYQQHVASGPRTRGVTTGHSVRGGIQVSLDRIEPSATRTLRRTYGVEHVYLVVEVADASAKKRDRDGADAELLGRSTRIGLSLEF